MKTINFLILASLITLSLSFVALSCKKSNDPNPPAPPISSASSPIISLTANYGQGEEVIISEINGKLLLDTLSPFSGTISFNADTTQPLLNVTVIQYDSIAPNYCIRT